ncbi:MAG: HTTM domain-containing protein [Balneolaceae bacterium]
MTLETSTWSRTLSREVPAAPLALFRMLFGTLMLWSILRFVANGWVQSLYLDPSFHFSYYGFSWVTPVEQATWLLFFVAGLASIGVLFGWKTRVSTLLFFLSFTWIELMDKTTYLNHYYFVSILSFLMLFLPMGCSYSLDAWKDPEQRKGTIPAWTVYAIQLLMAIVWLHAGLAKFNSDWLLRAMPLSIWLPPMGSMPLLGDLFQERWVHYAFSWGGALYDLSIPFLLFWNRTRVFALLLVVGFHLMTGLLFPIGMFPYIMIAAAFIFMDPAVHQRLLDRLAGWLNLPMDRLRNDRTWAPDSGIGSRLRLAGLSLFFLLQLLLPWRYLLYPGELFWTEEGFRFSWRVMLMEKTGQTDIRISDPDSGRSWMVDNNEHLTRFQEEQMSTQPDMILDYAHWLAETYRRQGMPNVHVYAESYVALNGRPSQRFIDPTIDLAAQPRNLKPKSWILPLHDTIHGL